MKRLAYVIPVLIFLAITALGPIIIHNSMNNQQNKLELAEINHIKYGLFSINVWKEKLSDIVFTEINKLDLKGTAQKMKKTVEAQLRALIDKVHEQIKESNGDSFKGRMKNAFIDAVVDMKDIKKGVPEYADTVIKEMTRPSTTKQVKSIATKQLKSMMNKTFDQQDVSVLTGIIERNGSQDIEFARQMLTENTTKRAETIKLQAWLLIGLSIALFIWAGALRQALPSTAFILLLPTLLILLVVGVTTPMIDMEAKISEMSFMLLGHPIKFTDQVLYFQTKSVLDVFWVMITHEQLQMKICGVLMIMFSIVFPVAKMFSSVVYYYDYRFARTNRWVKFFVLKSGKWSMTDVLVVAIFMAYIGFNGIISSHFGKMSESTGDIVILTTNGTSLQPGFYVFLTYSILALFLSNFLIRKPAHEPTLAEVLDPKVPI